MFTASAWLQNNWPGIGGNASLASASAPLSYIDCAMLDGYLYDDGIQVSYSAMVSIGDAIRGIEAGFCSWSIVKLYYSVFYGLRALLAFDGIAIFYVRSSPYYISIKPGSRPVRSRIASSHKLVFELFRRNCANSFLLSQTIDQECPLVWLSSQREAINYRNAKFDEPGIPSSLSKALAAGSIRRLIASYFQDDYFAFDPDHAIIAYPIAVTRELIKKCKKTELFDSSDEASLRKMLADSLGPITSFDAVLRKS